MTKKFQKIAFLFPGQGAQYPGMAKDFFKEFSAARLTFEEGDDLLKNSLSSLILNGPEASLMETRHSQLAIYLVSMAILRVVQELYEIRPFVCAGLSLGEYTALTAGEWLSFRQTLPLVEQRGLLMHRACQTHPGAMVVVTGLETSVVEKMVKEINLPHALWIANYNCPGQVVLSGTGQGIEAATLAAQAAGAKRVLPLNVEGAFHSGLMQSAAEALATLVQRAPLAQGTARLVMNVPGDFVDDMSSIKRFLSEQVSHSVRWERGIRAMQEAGVDLFVEFGPGKTLAGMNKRIGLQAPTISIEKIEDLTALEKLGEAG